MSEILDFKDYALSSAWDECLRRLGFVVEADLDFALLVPPSPRTSLLTLFWLREHAVIVATSSVSISLVCFELAYTDYPYSKNIFSRNYLAHKICPASAAYAFARKLLPIARTIHYPTDGRHILDGIEDAYSQVERELALPEQLPRFQSLAPHA